MIEVFDDNNQKSIKISKSQSIKDNIVFYGANNKYPSEMESIIDGSQTATLCVKTKSKFLSSKFVDERISSVGVGRTWINRKYTMQALVRDIAYNLAKYNGCYLQVTKNLGGEVVMVSVLDFTKCRFTEFDDTMRCSAVYYGDFAGTVTGKKKKNFVKFPLFTNNNELFKKMAESYNTTTSVYPIFIDSAYYYPKNPFESVYKDCLTEYEVQDNRYEEISEGSPAKLIIRTDFSENEDERREQIDEIRKFAGSKGRRVLVIKTAFDENGEPIESGYKLDTIQDTRDLSKFTDAEKAIAGNIRKALQIPSILVAPNDGATVDASAAQLRAAVDYYNDFTRDERDLITESLNEVFEKSAIEFPSKDFRLQDFDMTIRENNNAQ